MSNASEVDMFSHRKLGERCKKRWKDEWTEKEGDGIERKKWWSLASTRKWISVDTTSGSCINQPDGI